MEGQRRTYGFTLSVLLHIALCKCCIGCLSCVATIVQVGSEMGLQTWIWFAIHLVRHALLSWQHCLDRFRLLCYVICCFGGIKAPQGGFYSSATDVCARCAWSACGLLSHACVCPLHGCCPSQFVSRRISLLVCCTVRNRVARRQTYPEGFAVHSKALLYQGVDVLHYSGLLHCRQCFWSALMLFCVLHLLSPAPHCCLRRCVFAVLQAQMVIPGRLHKLNGHCFFLTGPVPPAPLPLVSQLPWVRQSHLLSETLCCFL